MKCKYCGTNMNAIGMIHGNGWGCPGCGHQEVELASWKMSGDYGFSCSCENCRVHVPCLKICVLGRNHDDWEKTAVEVLRFLGSPEATVKEDDDALYDNESQISGGLCIVIKNGTSEMGRRAYKKMNYFANGRGVYRWLIS